MDSTLNLVQSLKETGGATIMFDENPQRYYVGHSQFSVVGHDDFFRLREYLTAILRICQTYDMYPEGIGFWHHGSFFHVDPITTFRELSNALAEAEKRGEKSIWDSHERKVIWLDEHGK